MRSQTILLKRAALWQCMLAVGAFAAQPTFASPVEEPFDLQNLVCYAVADNSQLAGSPDFLVTIDPSTGLTANVGPTNTADIEAIDYNLEGNIVYAVNGGIFGRLALDGAEAGQFIPIGSVGTGNGAEGPITFSDIDSLTFDESNGMVFATHRREFGEPAQYDLLLRIDPNTGSYVPDAFGQGVDYVAIVAGDKFDVDDLASDPEDGTLYAVANEGVGRGSVLLSVDRETGVATIIGTNVDDIESLSFDPTGALYGTTGRGRSQGAAGDATRNRLYLINKTTGAAAPVGLLSPADSEPHEDFEAVTCRAELPYCLMYALHDEGKADSQVIRIDPYANNGAGSVSPLGPLYKNLDIEGLAILNGQLYGSSGSDGKAGIPDGHFYNIDRTNGTVSNAGATGFKEVSSLAMNPVDGTVWGWAKGRSNSEYVGPVKIDSPTVDGTSTAMAPSFPYDNKFLIEALAWKNDGTLLYAISYNKGARKAPYTDFGSVGYSSLIGFNPVDQSLSLLCPDIIKADVEAMEIQPNGLLLFGTDGDNELAIVGVDPESCAIVASRSFKNLPYDDIESIEWAATDCLQRSWLYPTSVDAEIELIEYDMIPPEAQEALRLALLELFDNVDIEDEDGNLIVYVGSEIVYTVEPDDVTEPRSGLRSDVAEIVEATLDDIDASGFSVNAVDANGNPVTYSFKFLAASQSDLISELSSFEDFLSYSVDGTVVTVETRLGTVICDLQANASPVAVAEGASLQAFESNIAWVGDADADGVQDDYLVTFSDGSQQSCLGR